MKKLALSILICLGILSENQAVFAAEFIPVITMTTQKAPGETINFSIVSYMETTAQVDFGDGALVDFAGSYMDISGTIGGSQTVTVFADPNLIMQVYVSDIQLTSLRLECYFLEELSCHGNLLTNLELGGGSPGRLDCSGNQLTALPFLAYSGISELRCSSNLLSSLDLSNANSLNTLECSYNQLSSLNTSACTNLGELRCEGNLLTQLDISGNANLYSLSCMDNQLVSAGITGLQTATDLRYLELSRNPIETLPDLTVLTSLNTITLDGCSLFTLPPLPVSIERIWASMESLEYLPDLSSLVNLELLSITGSKVREIPDLSMNTRMKTLRCWSGELRSLPDMSAHTGMTQLYCRNNKLTFEDLEANIGVTGFQYLPQDSLTFGEEMDTTFCYGGGMMLSARVDGAHNLYQWFKDGTALGDPSGDNSLDLLHLAEDDAGSYHCEVSNSLVSGMTMLGAATNIQVLDRMEVSATLTHDFCEKWEGSIDLEATGVGPITYKWSNGSTASDISNLRGGEYRVTVSDGNGCEARDTFQIESRSRLDVQPVWQHVSCGSACDGSIEINVSGGEPPYTFVWDDGEEGASRDSLCAGYYDVRVTDANGCYEDSLNYIWQPDLLVVEFQVEHAYCSASPKNGSVEVQVSGGNPPYTFNWDHGATTQNIQDLEEGTYTLSITDASGCILTDSARVNQIPSISFESQLSLPSCNGYSDGAIDLTVSGGFPPYIIRWNTGSEEEDLSGLAKGSYVVMVTDQMACTDSVRIELDEPESLASEVTVSPLSCAEAGDASASAVIVGGTQPYTYDWSNGETTALIEHLASGRFDLTVVDANGCTWMDSARIAELEPLSVIATLTKADCSGEAGSISLQVEGGIPPYAYNWSNGSSDKDISALPAGRYEVTVTDANACSKTWSGDLEEMMKACLEGKVRFTGGHIEAEEGSAIIFDASSSPYKAIQSVRIREEGAFQFSGLPAGAYIVYVKLDDHAQQNYMGVMHSYYQKTHKWEEAALLDLSCEDTLTMDMEMFENPASSNGKCTVKGNVMTRDGLNKAVTETSVEIVIFLIDKLSGLPIACTGLDSDGGYEFAGVPPGSYTIVVELAGLAQRTSHDIVIDEDTELIEGKDYVVTLGDNPDIEAVLDHTSINTVSRDDQLELCPNPAKEMVVLRSASFNDGPVYISLYSEVGSLVRKQKIYAVDGMTSEIVVPLEGLSAGSYLIRVEAGNMLVTRHLLVLD